MIARGALVAWDREFLARRAVAEEEGEITRLQEEISAQARHMSAAMLAEQQHLPEPVAVASPDAAPDVQLLIQDRAALLAKVEQQTATIAQSSAELESLRRFSSLARGVMVDLAGSRGYALMRLLGRWRSIERGINRALR